MPKKTKDQSGLNFNYNYMGAIQRWLNSLKSQGGMTRYNYPAYSPPSASYPGFGYPGYRSQGGIAWGAPPPAAIATPAASSVFAAPPATTTTATPTASPYGTSWGAFYNPVPALLTRGGPVTEPTTSKPKSGGASQGQGTPGYFAGVPNEYAPGGYYGGGWGNPNMVWGGEGYYRPSQYGYRAFGLSRENVNPLTGELQGSLNRYGQALGTPAPLMAQGPHRPGKGWASTSPYGPGKFRMPGVVHPRPKDPGKGGGGNKSGGGGGYWQNELISWRF